MKGSVDLKVLEGGGAGFLGGEGEGSGAASVLASVRRQGVGRGRFGRFNGRSDCTDHVGALRPDCERKKAFFRQFIFWHRIRGFAAGKLV